MSSTRRAVLTALGATALSGCLGLRPASAGSPPIDCGPESLAWPTYGYDAARTSRVPDRPLPPADAQPRRLSRTGANPDVGGSVDAPPVVAGGVAYVAGDVRIEARAVDTGNRLWATDPGGSVSTSPALGCGVVYVSTDNETLALDRGDGAVLWRADVGAGGPSNGSGSPVVDGDTVYIPGGGVAALDAETGDRRWRVRTDHVAQGLALTDRVYVGTGSNGGGGVAAVTRGGDHWWRTELGPVYAPPAVADDAVYAVSKTGTLAALTATDGTQQWQAPTESGVYAPPAVADGRVVVGAGNGTHAMAFDAETGDRLWRFETGVSQSAPVVVGDRVLVSGANAGVDVLDLGTGERRRGWDLHGVGSQPVVADGRLFYRSWNVSDVVAVA